jgi:hypothetical protein
MSDDILRRLLAIQRANSSAGTGNIKHGQRHTRLYKTWADMLARCRNMDNEHYAARGITVCKEWESFENFQRWALSNGYTDELEIDRKEVNGNYCPENCRWVTKQVNANNRRTNVYVTWAGETKTLADWARDKRCVVNYHLLWKRYKRGWDFEKAMTEGPDKK